MPKFQDVWPQIDEFPKLPDDIPAPRQPHETVTVLYGCWSNDDVFKPKYNEKPYTYTFTDDNGQKVIVQSDGEIKINEEDNKYGPRH